MLYQPTAGASVAVSAGASVAVSAGASVATGASVAAGSSVGASVAASVAASVGASVGVVVAVLLQAAKANMAMTRHRTNATTLKERFIGKPYSNQNGAVAPYIALTG